MCRGVQGRKKDLFYGTICGRKERKIYLFIYLFIYTSVYIYLDLSINMQIGRDIGISILAYVYVCIYVYLYLERERERSYWFCYYGESQYCSLITHPNQSPPSKSTPNFQPKLQLHHHFFFTHKSILEFKVICLA